MQKIVPVINLIGNNPAQYTHTQHMDTYIIVTEVTMSGVHPCRKQDRKHFTLTARKQLRKQIINQLSQIKVIHRFLLVCVYLASIKVSRV